MYLETNGKKNVLFAYVIHEREGKKHWTKIGIATRNRDGSLNCHLDAVPVTGTLHLREPRELSASDTQSNNQNNDNQNNKAEANV